MFNYLSFGFIPTGRFFRDIFGSLTGYPNLFKRLQAKTIIDNVRPTKGMRILDFGCGGGFFSYEFAKRGADVVALDIVAFPQRAFENLSGTLLFRTIEPDADIPCSDDSFDIVFVSEVLITLPDPIVKLREFYRVLAPGGKLIVVNTLGRMHIETAYESNSRFLEFLKRRRKYRIPTDYKEFCKLFFQSDNLKKKEWHSLEELQELIADAKFTTVETLFPFNATVWEILTWLQFINIAKGKGLGFNFNVFAYLLLELLNAIKFKQDKSNVIILGRKSHDASS